MNETYYAGVYWSARRESAEQCARRAETFFRLLSHCDSVYTSWFEQAGSIKKALQLHFEPTYDTFVRFFGKRTYRQGQDGFSFSAWTGHEQDGHGGMLMLRCGSMARVVPNSCLLYLPSAEPDLGRVVTASVMTEVLRSLVLAWEPDHGGVFSNGYQRLRDEPASRPYTGWLMYFPRHRGEVPALPALVRVEPVEDKGTLVILTPERFTVDSPVHVSLADEVRTLLDQAGLMKESSAYASPSSA